MPFDFELAIADLDRRGFGNAFAPTRDGLRDKYPELKAMFDELDDYRYEADKFGVGSDLSEAKREAEREQERLYDLVEELEARLAQIRDLAETLSKFDGGHAVRAELRTIALKADEAQHYASKQKEPV